MEGKGSSVQNDWDTFNKCQLQRETAIEIGIIVGWWDETEKRMGDSGWINSTAGKALNLKIREFKRKDYQREIHKFLNKW